MNMKKSIISCLCFFASLSLTAQTQSWTSVYTPGALDANGKFAGGNELMQIVSHKGRLFAGNSYWQEFDTVNNPRSAEVLRLDGPSAKWLVDREFSTANLRIGAMKSFIFSSNFQGQNITPDTLLITVPNDNTGKLSCFVRNDATGEWTVTTLASFPKDVNCRAIGLHKDQITNVTTIFAGLQDYGIFSGSYNPAVPGKIQWNNTRAEFVTPTNERVMGFTVCNNVVYVATSDGGIGHIYRRTDGRTPMWSLVKTTSGGPNGEDLRGLTAVPNPNGTGEVLWYSWNKLASRIDPNNSFAETVEYRYTDSLTKQLGVEVQYILAAYNDNIPMFNPTNSTEDVRLIGFEMKYSVAGLRSSPRPNWEGWATDGQYYERRQSGRNITYVRKYIVNNSPIIRDSLVATRTMCVSPFPSDSGKVVYAGGMDCNSIPMSRTAWIYRGNFRTTMTSVSNNAFETISPILRIYPNPASNLVFVQGVQGVQGVSLLTLTNVLGQTVMTLRDVQSPATLDVSSLPAGMYFLKVRTDKQFFTTPLHVIR
jgi:poly(A) polymerase